MEISKAEIASASVAGHSNKSASAASGSLELRGAEVLVKALQAEGVQYVWGYPGGAVLHIYDAFYKQDTIQHVLVRHEQAAVHAAEAATKGYNGMYLTIAAAYGGQQEITDAVQSLLREQLKAGNTFEQAIELVTPDAVGPYLYSPELPDPDLIIRTSGEIRLSGFLLWQSAYSEFHFTDVFWPEFRRIDFLRAIRAFQQRHRRHGQ